MQAKQSLRSTCQDWSYFFSPEIWLSSWPLVVALAVSPNPLFWSLICISHLPLLVCFFTYRFTFSSVFQILKETRGNYVNSISFLFLQSCKNSYYLTKKATCILRNLFEEQKLDSLGARDGFIHPIFYKRFDHFSL